MHNFGHVPVSYPDFLHNEFNCPEVLDDQKKLM